MSDLGFQLSFHCRAAANQRRMGIWDFTQCARAACSFDKHASGQFRICENPIAQINNLTSKAGRLYLWNLFSSQANTEHCGAPGDSLPPPKNIWFSALCTVGHWVMQVEKETMSGATITKQGSQDSNTFCRFIPPRVNPLLVSHWDRQHYLQTSGKQPKTGWIIINQMDFILKQTFLFCQTDFCFGKQLTLENGARNCRLHYNSSLGAIQLQHAHHLALLATQRLLVTGSCSCCLWSFQAAAPAETMVNGLSEDLFS